MKASLAISLFILVVAAAIGWRNEGRIAALREERERLATKTASGTFGTGAHDRRAVAGRESRRTEQLGDAQRIAADFIAYGIEMDGLELHGYPEDEVIRRRIIAQMDAMMALDAEQWKVVIDEIAGSEDLPKGVRKRLLDFAIERLTEMAPGEALVQLVDTPGRLEMLEALANNFGMNAVSQALQGWGRGDPTGAVSWYERNKGRLPDDLAGRARSAVLRGTATRDPRYTLELAEKLGEDPADWLERIAKVAEGAEGRRGALAAIREWRAAGGSPPQDALGEALRVLAQGSRYNPRRFDEVAPWIDDARLTAEELDLLTQGIERFIRTDETGKWIEWLGESLPEEDVRERAGPLMERWARRDFRAAGEWLATAPEGPAKESAILAYAAAIFPDDSEAALEWARTLPDGEERLRRMLRSGGL